MYLLSLGFTALNVRHMQYMYFNVNAGHHNIPVQLMTEIGTSKAKLINPILVMHFRRRNRSRNGRLILWTFKGEKIVKSYKRQFQCRPVLSWDLDQLHLAQNNESSIILIRIEEHDYCWVWRWHVGIHVNCSFKSIGGTLSTHIHHTHLSSCATCKTYFMKLTKIKSWTWFDFILLL